MLARTSLLLVLLSSGCVGTPQPDPPTFVPSELSIHRQTDTELVVEGRPGAIEPGGSVVRGLSLDGIEAADEILSAPDGSFVLSLDGMLPDELRLRGSQTVDDVSSGPEIIDVVSEPTSPVCFSLDLARLCALYSEDNCFRSGECSFDGSACVPRTMPVACGPIGDEATCLTTNGCVWGLSTSTVALAPRPLTDCLTLTPALELSVSRLSPGQTSVARVTIDNQCAQMVTVTPGLRTGMDGFTLLSGTAPFTVAAGQSASIEIQHEATGAVLLEDVLFVQVEGAESGRRPVTLRGGTIIPGEG